MTNSFLTKLLSQTKSSRNSTKADFWGCWHILTIKNSTTTGWRAQLWLADAGADPPRPIRRRTRETPTLGGNFLSLPVTSKWRVLGVPSRVQPLRWELGKLQLDRHLIGKHGGVGFVVSLFPVDGSEVSGSTAVIKNYRRLYLWFTSASRQFTGSGAASKSKIGGHDVFQAKGRCYARFRCTLRGLSEALSNSQLVVYWVTVSSVVKGVADVIIVNLSLHWLRENETELSLELALVFVFVFHFLKTHYHHFTPFKRKHFKYYY